VLYYVGDIPGMSDRIEITGAVKEGNIELALNKLNQLNLLPQQPDVTFALKKQAMIELIRKGDLLNALKFAQTELAPNASNSVRHSIFAN
jgi:glucose-induced degradation protein 8